jgi:hypothetical protein
MASSSGARVGRAGVLLAVLVPALLAWAAAPAEAHSSPAHYATVITSIQPAVRGVHVTAAADGGYLSITNPTHRMVIVLGYDGDDYLEITNHGVWQNIHSPTTYLNKDSAAVGKAGEVNRWSAPAWQQISTKDRWRFHDHRIHWAGGTPPVVVAQDPGKPHLIKNWTVDLLVDGTPVAINGTLRWYPASSRPAWLVFGGVSTAILIGFIVLLIRDQRRSER